MYPKLLNKLLVPFLTILPSRTPVNNITIKGNVILVSLNKNRNTDIIYNTNYTTLKNKIQKYIIH